MEGGGLLIVLSGMNNYTGEYKVRKFSELLSRLQNMFDSVREENSELYKNLAEFNKEDTIQEWQAKYAHLHSHSLHVMSDNELSSYTKFRAQHSVSCRNDNTFIVTLSGTDVGEAIEVACPVCGRKQNITDATIRR